ncbi:MAG: hypothetical protein CTY29_08260 [Methylobacter sp.]|nr:MAG: hypothetical protein CTY29_08260 [Methylobacter sp.]
MSQYPLPLIPPRASQLLAGIARRGAAGMPLVFGGLGKPFRKPLPKARSAGQGGMRVAFSLDTFFWRRKRKYLGCRSENRHLKKPSR